MEITDCIVSNPQQYVPLTARTGCKVEFGRVLRGQTGEAHDVLFENADGISIPLQRPKALHTPEDRINEHS